jgi:hypothetical protein
METLPAHGKHSDRADMHLTIDFAVGGNAKEFQGQGWSSPEVSGSWSLGAESGLRLPTSFDEPHHLTLQLAGCAIPGQSASQRLGIMLNNRLVANLEVRAEEELEIVLPAERGQRRFTEITFRHPDFRVPLDHGLQDDRPLAIHFKRMRLQPVSVAEQRDVELRKLPQVLIIGQSHMAAVERAAMQREFDDQVVLRLEFFSVMGYDRWVWWQNGFQYDPDVVSKIDELLSNSRFDAVISMLGGNDHFVHGALNHPRKFDFVMPSRPDLVLAADAELVSYDMVCERARYDVEAVLGLLGTALRRKELPFFHVSAPPPVKESKVLIKHLLHYKDSELGRRMESDLNRFGVAPAEFRLKLWLVYSLAAREVCEKYRITYIEPPPSVMDEYGYILPHLASDSLHGTDAYGQLVISDIATRLAPKSA